MTEKNILHEADARVSLTAQPEYGDPRINLARIAVGWSELLGVDVRPDQVAACMIWLKLARLSHAYKRDSVVDVAGYARCMEIVCEQSSNP